MLDSTSHITVVDSLPDLYTDFAIKFAALGADYMAYGSGVQVGATEKLRSKWEYTNNPKAWRARYVSRGYDSSDPTLLPLFNGVTVSPWSASMGCWQSGDVAAALRDRAFFADAERSGLSEGIVLAVACTGFWRAYVALASSTGRLRYSPKESLQVLAFELHLAKTHLEQRLTLLEPDSFGRLSQKEREVLDWVSKGKSSWEIGVIVGISENTVNFHLKSAMQKLGVSSRSAAIMKAHKLGFID